MAAHTQAQGEYTGAQGSAMADFASIALANGLATGHTQAGYQYQAGGESERPAKRARSNTPDQLQQAQQYQQQQQRYLPQQYGSISTPTVNGHAPGAYSTPMTQTEWNRGLNGYHGNQQGYQQEQHQQQPPHTIDIKQQSEVELLLNFSRTAVLSPTAGIHGYSSPHAAFQRSPAHQLLHGSPNGYQNGYAQHQHANDGHLRWSEVSRVPNGEYRVPSGVRDASDALGILQPQHQQQQYSHNNPYPQSYPAFVNGDNTATNGNYYTEPSLETAIEADVSQLLAGMNSQNRRGRGGGRGRGRGRKRGRGGIATSDRPRSAHAAAVPKAVTCKAEVSEKERLPSKPFDGFGEDFTVYFTKDVLNRELWSALFPKANEDLRIWREQLAAHNLAVPRSAPRASTLLFPTPHTLQAAQQLNASNEQAEKSDFDDIGTPNADRPLPRRRHSITLSRFTNNIQPDLESMPSIDNLSKTAQRGRRLSLPAGLGNCYASLTPVQAEAFSEDIERDEYGQITLCGRCEKTTAPSMDGDGDPDGVSWINCDGCKKWFHITCAGFTEEQVKNVGKYSCPDCVKTHGATTFLRKSGRAHSNVDYARLNQGVIESTEEEPDHPYVEYIRDKIIKFLPDKYPRLTPDLVTREYFESEEIWKEPVVIPAFANPRPENAPDVPTEADDIEKLADEGFTLGDDVADRLDMVMPKELTVRGVAELYGPQEKVEVMDVKNQGEDGGWNMGRWADYYESRHKRVIRNVISLEVSKSKLGKLVRRPKVVRDLDLVDSVWPAELKAKGIFPKVQLYCLMSVENSYTDFHVDFGGSSVFYHILRGKKTFLFIPPRPKNLKKYEQWCLSPMQNNMWFAGMVGNECVRVDLSAGDTMLIPSGWIHAVWTPEDSLVLGGNFLTRLTFGMQTQIAQVEKTTKVPNKFKYPNFQKIMWFTLLKYLRDDPLPEVVSRGLCSGELFDRARFEEVLGGTSEFSDKPGTVLYNARQYSRLELEGLTELTRFVLRTALIACGKLTDGITTETRRRVDTAIPKAYIGTGLEPLDVVRQFAWWSAWKRGNERIPIWSVPTTHPAFESGLGGPEKKFTPVELRKLDKPITPRSIGKHDKAILDPEAIKAAAIQAKMALAVATTQSMQAQTAPTSIVNISSPPKTNGVSSHALQPGSVPTFASALGSFAQAAASLNAFAFDFAAQAERSAPESGAESDKPSKKPRSQACDKCRRQRRKCVHDEAGNIDPEKVRLAALAREQTQMRKKQNRAAEERVVSPTPTRTSIVETPIPVPVDSSERLLQPMPVDQPVQVNGVAEETKLVEQEVEPIVDGILHQQPEETSDTAAVDVPPVEPSLPTEEPLEADIMAEVKEPDTVDATTTEEDMTLDNHDNQDDDVDSVLGSTGSSDLSSVASAEPPTAPTSALPSEKDPSPVAQQDELPPPELNGIVDEPTPKRRRSERQNPSPLVAQPVTSLAKTRSDEPETVHEEVDNEEEPTPKRRKSAREAKQVERFIPSPIHIPAQTISPTKSSKTLTPGRSPAVKTPLKSASRTPLSGKKSISPKLRRNSLPASKAASSPTNLKAEVDGPIKTEDDNLLELLRKEEFGLRRRK